ncbi:unnamed protein product, partial [marine sediment metagenome]
MVSLSYSIASRISLTGRMLAHSSQGEKVVFPGHGASRTITRMSLLQIDRLSKAFGTHVLF